MDVLGPKAGCDTEYDVTDENNDVSCQECIRLRTRVKELEEALDKGIDGAMDEDLMPTCHKWLRAMELVLEKGGE